MMDTDDLAVEIGTALSGPAGSRFAVALAVVLRRFSAPIGTLHRLGDDGHLHLMAASEGLPPPVLEMTRRIPLGKGIAGEAAQTGKPVTMCNLQTDRSGVARPGAKATGAGGTLCVPVFLGDRVVGTLGIGYPSEHEFTPAETEALIAAGRAMAEVLSSDKCE